MDIDLTTGTATRTLRAAGFAITDVTRHGSHIEFQCERDDAFGATVRYLIAISASDAPSPDTEYSRAEAERTNRTLVLVARRDGPTFLSWAEFLDTLGGAVPQWRALDHTYSDALRYGSRNELPPGAAGEAWRLFESAVADGLEFTFGRHVKRMGGAKRFQPLPDMLAVTPDDILILIDAKATAGGTYELQRPNLRPLAEYVDRQRDRQRGDLSVGGALIVAGGFTPRESLNGICNDFLAEKRIPLALLEVETMIRLVDVLRDDPTLRTRIRWRRLVSRVGLTDWDQCQAEIDAARGETLRRDLR